MILSRVRAKKLRESLRSVEVFEPEVDDRQAIKHNTLVRIRKALSTVDAFHRVADIADRYVKEIETRVELGHKVPEADLRFMNEFSQELASA